MTAVDDVKEYLRHHAIEVREFQEETATAATAAAAVGCSVAEIAKTLLFIVGGQPVVVVTCGDMKVKSSPLKKEFALSGKVKLPQAEDVIHYTGYSPGGVCPFLLPPQLPIRLGCSLQRFPVVYAAAGNSFSAVPITVDQLRSLTGASLAQLCEPIPTKS